METSNKVTSLRVYKNTLERFNSYGKKNQTSDALLKDMMDAYEALKSGAACACHSAAEAVRHKEPLVSATPKPAVAQTQTAAPRQLSPHLAQARELVIKIETLMMKGFDMEEACRQAAGKAKRNVYFNALENLMKENAYQPPEEYVEWLKRNGKYSAWVRGIEGIKNTLHKQGFRVEVQVPA